MEKFSYICDIMRYKMLFLLLFMAVTMTAQNPKREFRGAWIQSVNGQFQGMGRDRMQQVLTSQLDDLQKDGINAGCTFTILLGKASHTASPKIVIKPA